jgi:hypothetical protein
LNAYRSFEIDQGDPAVADAMFVKLAFHGSGGGTAPVEVQDAMLAFASRLYTEITQSAPPESISATPEDNQPGGTMTPTPPSMIEATAEPPSGGPGPLPMPTLEPARIPDLFRDRIDLQARMGETAPFLQEIVGWEPGYRSTGYCGEGPFRWLDSQHLLLFPIVGLEEGMGLAEWTRPLVLDLGEGDKWLPPSDGAVSGCDLPVWSDSMGVLMSTQGGELWVSRPDGQVLWQVPGSAPLDLAPSGRRVLAGTTWVDLENGETVRLERFDWDGLFKPAWSFDERRLFNCCFIYGDVDDGPATRVDLGSLRQVGRGVSPGFSGIQNLFVGDGNLVMMEWDFFEGDSIGFVPLIDPVEEEYQSLHELANLPEDNPCGAPEIGPGGQFAWVPCGLGAYLVDLSSLQVQGLRAQGYPPGSRLVSWSPQGEYAFVQTGSRDGFEIVGLEREVRQTIEATNVIGSAWDPTGNLLAALTGDGARLFLLEVPTSTGQELDLPARGVEVAWSPTGTSLAIREEEGSLWWVPEIRSPKPEVIVSSDEGMDYVRFSPDGNRLAFRIGRKVGVITLDHHP